MRCTAQKILKNPIRAASAFILSRQIISGDHSRKKRPSFNLYKIQKGINFYFFFKKIKRMKRIRIFLCGPDINHVKFIGDFFERTSYTRKRRFWAGRSGTGGFSGFMILETSRNVRSFSSKLQIFQRGRVIILMSVSIRENMLR